MNWQMIGGMLARHALTTAGGFLAAHGYLGSTTSEQFIAAGMVFVGVALSWWQKTGQVLVAAQLAKLQHHVDAIPVVPVVSAAEGRPAVAIQVLRVNDAINAAKEVAAATPAEAAVLPPPVSLPLGVTRDQRN